jgi:hypothetical protein
MWYAFLNLLIKMFSRISRRSPCFLGKVVKSVSLYCFISLYISMLFQQTYVLSTSDCHYSNCVHSVE